jgi:hypothetical protein
LESLEQRDCPSFPSSGPQISNFAGRILSSNSVELTGNVSDATKNNVTVVFSGGGSGSTLVALNANDTGAFDVVLSNVVNIGTFFSEAADQSNQVSQQVSVIAGNGPTLTLACNQQANRQVRVFGTVRDVIPANETVTFSGVISGSTTTDANGNFAFAAPASALGNISATATNSNNVTSSSAQTQLTNAAPGISNFWASVTGTTWTMTGQVTDEWAMGLTVNVSFPGLTAPLQATVGADDCFSVSTITSGSPSGMASAQTTDWWGVPSNLAQFPIR